MLNNQLQPKYRYFLRAKIHEAGYRTLTEFSQNLGVDLSRISRICSGWEIPSLSLSQNMAKELGITPKEFHGIL